LHPAVSAYRCGSGLPRTAHPSAGPANDSSGLPDFLVAWPCRRWIFGLPRISHASTVRVVQFGVASCAPPFRAASDSRSELPRFASLRLCRRWIVESPRFTHPSAVPVVKASGCPSASHSRYRRRSGSRLPQFLYLRPRLMVHRVASALRTIQVCLRRILELPRRFYSGRCRTNFKVALNLRSFSVAAGSISESPRISLPRLSVDAPFGLPLGCIYVWVDDDPNCLRTLHPQLALRMNLRVQSGVASPLRAFNAFSISLPPTRRPASRQTN